MSLFANNIIVYISGFVGKALAKQLDREPCITSLFHKNPDYAKNCTNYALLSEKDNCGLFIPSEVLVTVCKELECVIREVEVQGCKNVKSINILNISLRRLLANVELFTELRYTCTDEHTA